MSHLQHLGEGFRVLEKRGWRTGDSTPAAEGNKQTAIERWKQVLVQMWAHEVSMEVEAGHSTARHENFFD